MHNAQINTKPTFQHILEVISRTEKKIDSSLQTISYVVIICKENVILLASCKTDKIMIMVQTVWLQKEEELSLCRSVVGMIGSTIGLKR